MGRRHGMRKNIFIFGLGFLLILAPWVHGQDPEAIGGKWWNQEKEAQIEIYPCAGKYCGKIVWLKEPNYPSNDVKGMGHKPKVDRENPDPSQRERPILGMNLVWGFTFSGGNLWEGGFIYDPRDGKTYKCKITLETPDHLKVRGYIGIPLIGKTNDWTRVK
jgi:uncharacterized protein (DUF2147 family)